MCHKIRTAMMQPQEKLGGIVEVDETYVGGDDHNRHWDKKKGKGAKVPVIGAVQRKGNVIARVLVDTGEDLVITFITEAVSNKVSLIATDAWPGYKGIPTTYPHGAVDHHRGQYVVGTVHTNTIEGFGHSLSAALLACSRKSAPSICRCTLLNFSSATIIGSRVSLQKSLTLLFPVVENCWRDAERLPTLKGATVHPCACLCLDRNKRQSAERGANKIFALCQSIKCKAPTRVYFCYAQWPISFFNKRATACRFTIFPRYTFSKLDFKCKVY